MKAVAIIKGGNPKANAVAEIEAFRNQGVAVNHADLRVALEAARAADLVNLGNTPIANTGAGQPD